MRFHFAQNTSPITDAAAWWDGTLTCGAPAGTVVQFIARESLFAETVLFETTTDTTGRAAFFHGSPAIPLGAARFQGLSVEIKHPDAGPVSFGTAVPQPPREVYFVPVTVSGCPTQPGTPYSHGIVISDGFLFARALSVRP